jgi:hypothetical protein
VPDASRKTSTSTVPGAATTSIPRTGLAAVLAAAGIAWIAVYINVAQDGQSLTWMGELGRWNFLIGIALIFLALIIASHPSTPLGRGRGVVVGMLGCFLIGLLWIIVYYIAGPDNALPVLRNLEQYNLLVGIAFMGVGFVFATKWE